MIQLYIEHHVLSGDGDVEVLHVAPEFGLYRWLSSQPAIRYTGSDIDATRYRHIDNVRTADLTALPFESEQFDLVICSHVLEHVPDDGTAMAEIRRVLRPDGRALLLVPFATDGGGTDEDLTVTDPEERERRFGQHDHVRLYSPEDFISRLTDAGFEVTTFAPFDEYPGLADEHHLNPDEVLPVGLVGGAGARC